MTLKHFTKNSDLKIVLATLNAEGAVIIDNLTSPENMDQIASELHP